MRFSPVLIAALLSPAWLRAEEVPQPAKLTAQPVAVQPLPGLEIRYGLLDAGNPVSDPGRLEGSWSAGAWELRSSALLHPDTGASQRTTRLDTGLRVRTSGMLGNLVVGDTLASGGGWSRPVRIGGFRFGRALSLRPGIDAMPRPGAADAAALPSTAFAAGQGDGVSRPGSLRPPSVPMRQLPIATPLQLARGASDYEVEAGQLRRGWGTAEDHYGEPYAAAAYRRGLAWLTAEVRTEWTPERVAAGMELVRGLGGLGQLNAVLGHSHGTAESGSRWGLGLARQAMGAAWRVSWDSFDRGYTPVAAVASEADPRSRLRAGVSGPVGRRLTAGLSLERRSDWDATPGSVVGLSLGYALSGGGRLSLDLSEQGGTKASPEGRVVWTLPAGTLLR